VAVFRPRTRLVNFRLSEDEYQQLKDSCARSGARSVSDYARAAVLTGAGFASSASPLSSSPFAPTAGEASQHLADVLPLPSSGLCPDTCPQRWQRLEGTVQEIQQSLQILAQQLQLSPLRNPAEERAVSHG
jgi:hypothetical protein